MPKAESFGVGRKPPRPAVGALCVSSEDEAMTVDPAFIPGQVKAMLDNHAHSMEKMMKSLVCDSQERLLEATRADIRAIRDHVESLRPMANFAQRFPVLGACLGDKQEEEVEQEPDPIKPVGDRDEPAAENAQVPELMDQDAGRETRRIVEDCVEKLWRLQARSLGRVQTTWTDTLQDLLASTDAQGKRDAPEQPPRLTPRQPTRPPASPDSHHSRRNRGLDHDDACVHDDGHHDEADERTMSKPSTTDEWRPRKPSAGSSDTLGEDAKAMILMKNESERMKDSHARFMSGSKERRVRATLAEKAKLMVEIESTIVLLANVVWMAVAVEIDMANVRNGQGSPGYFFWVDLCFVILMSLEILAKLFLYRMGFFFGPGHRWNLFDVVLICLAAIDLALSAANLSFIRLLRGLRAVRATRVIRTVAIVPELRLMFASVTASAASLFWAFVLLILVLFLCALGVQQTVHSRLESHGIVDMHENLLKYYGSLPRTMLSLFMAISGGADWKDLCEPLSHISRVYDIAYILFIILTVFGLLNILTAVFVEKTSNIARVDPELVIQESVLGEADSVKHLLTVLYEADDHASGKITKAAYEAKLEDPRFRAQLQLLDITQLEAEGAFRLLDSSKSDCIEIEELVYGLMRMRGQARAMDVNTMLYDNKRLLTKLAHFSRSVDQNFKEIRQSLAAQGIRPFAFTL